MLADAEKSHRSWFERGCERLELGSVTLLPGRT